MATASGEEYANSLSYNGISNEETDQTTTISPSDAVAYDRQSLSRSMSRASSQSTDDIKITTTSHETNGNTNHHNGEVGDDRQLGGGSAQFMENTSLLDPVSDSNVNVSTNVLSSDNVSIQNDVQDKSPLHTAQNGIINTVPNLAAVIPDTGASAHTESTAKPSETLPVPSATEASSATKTMPQTPGTPAPRSRLPNDTIGILEDRIKEDPRGDLQAWLSLVEEHKKRGKKDEARKVYERFISVFPAAAEVWVAYIQLENESGDRHATDRILDRVLLSTPYLPLWSTYLDHIRRYNNLTTDADGQARQIIHRAYDIALKHVGLDKESGKLWQDYVNFIKAAPGTIGGSNWQDQQKMDSLREVYRRAVSVPHQFTNLLWKEYDGFEMSLNKTTVSPKALNDDRKDADTRYQARKFLQDQSPAYMSARSSYIELQNITRNLRRTSLPILPPAPGFAGDVEYMEQLNIWKRWIQWEKDDPLVLKQDEIASYRARVGFVYKHALMAMRFWPELWCDASDFCFTNEMESEGSAFLAQGIAANPESCLLAFKQADRIEYSTANENGDNSALSRGNAVREPYKNVLDTLYDLISKVKNRETQEIARIEATFVASSESLANGDKDEDDNDVNDQDEDDRKEKQKKEQIEAVKSAHVAQTTLLTKTISHVWIALMRAMRRVQGKGKVNDVVPGLRGTFSDARKRGRINSDVYVAAALIEFHCYDVETGKKIFERGLKLFPEDEAFALEYIKHLVANNDHTNARVVFETAVNKLAQKPETLVKAKPLYAYFHSFESQYGELTQIMKLEKRMRDLFPDDPTLAAFSRRFVEKGFDPTEARPIISPAAQTKPKVIQSIENGTTETDSPPRVIQTAPSPKRPLPLDDSDTDSGRPPKIARGTREVSPLKGAAGRRLDQQKRNQPPQPMPQINSHPIPVTPLPPPLPRDVMFLLSIIPKAETYHATKFNPEALVKLIRETHIPTHISQLPHPPAGRGPPPQPPPPQPMPMPMPQYQQNPPMQQMHHAQYGGQYPGVYLQFLSSIS
ncbi:mRNA 3'-end-processing protein rna14 [Lecanora helva]